MWSLLLSLVGMCLGGSLSCSIKKFVDNLLCQLQDEFVELLQLISDSLKVIGYSANFQCYCYWKLKSSIFYDQKCLFELRLRKFCKFACFGVCSFKVIKVVIAFLHGFSLKMHVFGQTSRFILQLGFSLKYQPSFMYMFMLSLLIK